MAEGVPAYTELEGELSACVPSGQWEACHSRGAVSMLQSTLLGYLSSTCNHHTACPGALERVSLGAVLLPWQERPAGRRAVAMRAARSHAVLTLESVLFKRDPVKLIAKTSLCVLPPASGRVSRNGSCPGARCCRDRAVCWRAHNCKARAGDVRSPATGVGSVLLELLNSRLCGANI